MNGGKNPYVKFILVKNLNKILPFHLIGEITSLFVDIYNNGVGKLIEGVAQLEIKVIAKRLDIKAVGSKAVTTGIGQILILDRKTPPAVEYTPSLNIDNMEGEQDETTEHKTPNIENKKQTS